MHTPHTRAYCNPSHNSSLAGSMALPVRAQVPRMLVTWAVHRPMVVGHIICKEETGVKVPIRTD